MDLNIVQKVLFWGKWMRFRGEKKIALEAPWRADWKDSRLRQRGQLEETVVSKCEMTKTYTVHLERVMKSGGQRQEIYMLEKQENTVRKVVQWTQKNLKWWQGADWDDQWTQWSDEQGRKTQEQGKFRDSGAVGNGWGRILNTLTFKCLGDTPVVGGKYGCRAQWTGRAVYMTLRVICFLVKPRRRNHPGRREGDQDNCAWETP